MSASNGRLPLSLPLSPAARMAKTIESNQYDHAAKCVPCSLHRLWTCDECGQAGMTILVQQCPECQHYRCTNCNTFSPKSARASCQKYTLEKDDIPDTVPPRSSPKGLSPSDNPAGLSMFQRDEQEVDSSTADEDNNLFLSLEMTNSAMAMTTELPSRDSTPLLEVVLTPTSSLESNTSSRVSSRQDYMDSETEYDTDTESIDGMRHNEDPMEIFDNAIDNLDSRLFSILNHDLELASRLIPQIHAQMRLGFKTEIRVCTASSSHESEGGYVASGSTRTGRSYNASPREKRGREREESKDRGDKSGSKRPRRFRDRSAVPRHRYACHFNKKDPARYCPLNDSRFKTCLGRGNPLLRRMKEHYINAHRPSQCERCYAIFKNRDELKDHRQAASPCHNEPDMLKEGIDDSQWAKIEPMFHVKRKLSPAQKEQDDFDKWFKIWDILFPNDLRPSDPWVHVLPESPNPLPNDSEGLLLNFNTIIQLDVERGFLQLDQDIHQRYERAFRLALQTRAAVSALAIPFSHSLPRVNEPENNTNKHLLKRQSAAGVLDSSFSKFVSSQSMPEHLTEPCEDHVLSKYESQAVTPSSMQFDIIETTNSLLPSNKTELHPHSNALCTSIGSESRLDLTGISTTQQHLNLSSSVHHNSEAMVLGPVASNTHQTQTHRVLSRISESSQASYSDPYEEDFMIFDDTYFEFDEERLDSDTLTRFLESENGDPSPLAL